MISHLHYYTNIFFKKTFLELCQRVLEESKSLRNKLNQLDHDVCTLSQLRLKLITLKEMKNNEN